MSKIVVSKGENDPAPEYAESNNYLIYDRQNTKTFVMTCFTEKQLNCYLSILKIHCRELHESNPMQQAALKKAFAELGIKKDPSTKELREHFRVMVE